MEGIEIQSLGHCSPHPGAGCGSDAKSDALEEILADDAASNRAGREGMARDTHASSLLPECGPAVVGFECPALSRGQPCQNLSGSRVSASLTHTFPCGSMSRGGSTGSGLSAW